MALAALARGLESVLPATAPSYAPEHPLLQQARAEAATSNLPYAGDVTPAAAWELVEQRAAVLVDVRTAEERKFVGYVPGSVPLPWLIGTAMQTNPRFLRELAAKVPANGVVLLLCRSGARSVAAATAATRAGLQHAYNILEGFEGDLDQDGHRGSRNGWRLRGLPWVQD